MILRLARFVQERFPPLVHLPLVAAFTAGNAALAGGGAPWPRLGLLALAVLCFFLRLRVFDELKDEATDRVEHPDRPLARGLVSRGDLRGLALCLLLIEAGLSWRLGCLTAWVPAVAWSLLMRREFFCGAWLRPKMELYAVSHTLVAAGLGAWIALAVAGAGLPAATLVLIGLVDWAMFNLYEFARKTWAADEEPAGDSYSRRLGRPGAVALGLSQLLIAAAAAGWLLRAEALASPGLGVCVAAGLAVAILAALRPTRRGLRCYRAVMGLELLAVYLVLALAGGRWRPDHSATTCGLVRTIPQVVGVAATR